MTASEKINKYEEEIATMKVMIYSLKQAFDDTFKALGTREADLVKTEKWEEDCRKVAKEYIKNERENEVQE